MAVQTTIKEWGGPMTVRRISSSALIGLAVSMLSPAPAGGQQRGEDLVRAFTAEWKARRAKVHAVTCSAKVETFYPKGYLSEQSASSRVSSAGKSPYPEEDKLFKDETASWAVDFANQRVRKEYHVTNPFDYGGKGGERDELAPDYGLHLFKGGDYKLFRPKDTYPKRAAEGALTPDVFLYESASHMFLLSFSDLPLLWLAGGVSGEHPMPTRTQHLADSARFSYHREEKWRGHDCAVLTVQEQKSRTAVREFWVGIAKPHLIYACRARAGDSVWWRVEVDYRDSGGHFVPTGWTCTEYPNRGKTFSRRRYSVQQIEVNPSLSGDLFEKPLQPGMVVFAVKRNEPLEVMSDGSLGPLGSYRAGRRWLRAIAWGAGAVAALAALAYAWRRYRSRPAAL